MFDWITNFIEQAGYAGIALLMLLENVFPPIPSELVMPLAGFTAARGDTTAVGVVIAGTIGSVLGALFWYYIGRFIGTDRLKQWAGKHGRWLTLSPREVDKVDAWFDKHCGSAVFLGRLIPGIRTLISVPAGLFEMGIKRFLMFTTLGSLLWVSILTAAGYLLEDNYEAVGRYLNPVANLMTALIVGTYLYRVVTWKRA
jgi:membrane protein DedA with SNARE-associated domain